MNKLRIFHRSKGLFPRASNPAPSLQILLLYPDVMKLPVMLVGYTRGTKLDDKKNGFKRAEPIDM